MVEAAVEKYIANYRIEQAATAEAAEKIVEEYQFFMDRLQKNKEKVLAAIERDRDPAIVLQKAKQKAKSKIDEVFDEYQEEFGNE